MRMGLLKYVFAFFPLWLVGCAADSGYNSGQLKMADCSDFPIQVARWSFASTRFESCVKQTPADPRLVGRDYHRRIIHESGIAVIGYTNAGIGTHIRHRDVYNVIVQDFHDIGGGGFDFKKAEKLDLEGRIYETQEFRLRPNAACFGFVSFGTAKSQGYSSKIYGYACIYGPVMTQAHLGEVIQSVSISSRH